MSSPLTRGAIEAIYSRKQCRAPVVQVTNLKLIKSSNADANQPPRYRLVLSDGQHSLAAMLASQLNHMVENGHIVKLCFLRLDEYLCNEVAGKRIVVILECEPVGTSSTIIGDPQPLESQQPQSTGSSNQGFTMNQQTSSRPSFGNRSQTSSHSHEPQFSPDGQPIVPIKALNPYIPKWTIKARVTSKSDRRQFSNARGPGYLVNVELLDAAGGEIRATMFTDIVDKFDSLLQENKVYIISGGSVRYANKKYSANIKNDYEITFDASTTIIPVQDEQAIPKVNFHFVEIADIIQQPKDSILDVIGIVKEVGQLDSINTRAGDQLTKRVITLADNSLSTIDLTVWGEKAEQFSATPGSVLALKGVKVSDFNVRSLTGLRSTIYSLDPELPEAHRLQTWWDSEGAATADRLNTVSRSEFKKRSEDGAFAPREDIRKTFSQIKEEKLGHEGPVFFRSRGVITVIKRDQTNPPWYMACPHKGCNKKVVLVSGTGKWHCSKCGTEYSDANPRYILSITANDHTGSAWLTCFDEAATKLLGVPAPQMDTMLQERRLADYEQVFQAALFRMYSFTIRAAEMQYENDARIKCTVTAASPVDFKAESRYLANQIEKYAQL